MPRFRIAWVMLLVAIAALNLGAIRAMSDSWGRTSGLLGLGVLPMTNVLAVGLMIGYRNRESRTFLLGFEAFGATVLALYAAVIPSSAELSWTYFAPAVEVWRSTIGPFGTTVRGLLGYSFLSLWATWPQLAFALFGGFLTRSFAASREQRRGISSSRQRRSATS